MFTYTLTFKNVPDAGLYLEALQAANPNIELVDYDENLQTIHIDSSTEIYGQELSTLDAIVPPYPSQIDLLKPVIRAAMTFGQEVVVEFAAENVALGITQAGKTSQVLDATRDIITFLQTGSLYSVLEACREVPADKKDDIFVTDTRLLKTINTVETYLGLPVSTEL